MCIGVRCFDREIKFDLSKGWTSVFTGNGDGPGCVSSTRDLDSTRSLVPTTAGSSAAGVELSTDDYRQPTGSLTFIFTDENNFF
jgi:hypothetical protein